MWPVFVWLSHGTFHIVECHKLCIQGWKHKGHKEHRSTQYLETSVNRSNLTTEDEWLNYTSLKPFLPVDLNLDFRCCVTLKVFSCNVTHLHSLRFRDHHICLLTLFWVDPDPTGANVIPSAKPSSLFQLAKSSFKSHLPHEAFPGFPKPVVSSSSSEFS